MISEIAHCITVAFYGIKIVYDKKKKFKLTFQIAALLYENEIEIKYLNVKRVPMSSMDKSSAFEVGKVNLYL